MKRVCLLIALLAVGCAPTRPAEGTGRVIHVIACWLKHPGDIDERRKLIDASHRFAKLPGVVRVQTGAQLPIDKPRPIDDTTYDVLVVMTFENERALQKYQDGDAHQKAVKNTLQPLTKRIVVYDAAEYAPPLRE